MKNKTIFIALAVALALSLAANAVLAVMLARERKDSYKHLYDPQYAIGGESGDENAPVEETTEPRFQITTKIISLSLPVSLEDKIDVSTEEDAQGANITVKAKGYAQDVTLFSVVLSKSEPESYLLGVLEDEAQGTWYAAVNVEQISAEGWSEEQYSEICALQQCVNDLMIQIQEDQRFISTRAQNSK